MFKKIAATLLLLIGSVSAALPQAAQLDPGQLWANDTAAQRPGRPASLSSLIDRAFNSNQGAVFNRGPTVWAATRTPVLGLAGTATGTLGFSGLTSGTMTVSPQSVAGTGTLLLPNLAGTIVAGATSPLVASATTGVMSCPTCVTSTGGGAITGTAPISVSAAGVVSITSPLPLTNGGTAASLTASNGGIVWSNATQLQLLAGTATARLPLLSGATATPVWGAFTIPASVTSGGIAYFSSATAMASTGALTANSVVIGGGAGVSPSITNVGTSGQLLLGSTSAAPLFATMSGDATITNAGALTVAANAITFAKIQQVAANTVPCNATGALANLTACSTVQLTALVNVFSTTLSGAVPAPGTSTGKFLRDDATWQPIAGSGTVTSVSAGTGIAVSPSPITTTGSVSLAAVGANTVLANPTAGSAAPTATAVPDCFGALNYTAAVGFSCGNGVDYPYLWNGSMSFWQRGTSFNWSAGAFSPNYQGNTADGVIQGMGTGATAVVQKYTLNLIEQSNVPNVINGPSTGMRMTWSVAPTAGGGQTGYTAYSTYVELKDNGVRNWAGKQVTVSLAYWNATGQQTPFYIYAALGLGTGGNTNSSSRTISGTGAGCDYATNTTEIFCRSAKITPSVGPTIAEYSYTLTFDNLQAATLGTNPVMNIGIGMDYTDLTGTTDIYLTKLGINEGTRAKPWREWPDAAKQAMASYNFQPLGLGLMGYANTTATVKLPIQYRATLKSNGGAVQFIPGASVTVECSASGVKTASSPGLLVAPGANQYGAVYQISGFTGLVSGETCAAVSMFLFEDAG